MKDFTQDRNKFLYVVIGHQGSGKTVLAKQLKYKIGDDVKIFDDFPYTRQRPTPNNDIMARIIRCRHTGERTIVTLLHLPKEQFNFKTNHYITWVLTSINPEIYYGLKKHLRLRDEKIIKFAKSYERSVLGLRKTRPYLVMTVNDGEINYENHRFKNNFMGERPNEDWQR